MFTKVQKAFGEIKKQQGGGFPSRLLKAKNKLLQTKFSQEIFQRGMTVFCCVSIIVFGVTLLSKADPITTSIGQDISTNNLSLSGNVTSGTWAGSSIDVAHGGTGQDWSAGTQGSLPFFSGTGALSTLTPGTAGQFLQSGGVGGNPSWGNVTRSATFVIAASDSSTKSKQQADYVCDGTDDQVEIQATITALGSLGGTIHFSSGHYYMSSPILYTDSIIFEGEGWNSSFLVLANGANCNIFQRTSETTTTNFFNEWRDLQFAGNPSNNTSGTAIYSADYTHDYIIERCFFDGFKTNDIYLAGSWNININSCIFEHSAGYAVYLYGGSDVRITNNKFLYNYNGIYGWIDKSEINTNFFFHLTEPRNIDIYFESATNNKVIGNSFSGNGSAAYNRIIYIHTSSSGNIISDNTLDGYNLAVNGISDNSSNDSSSGPNIFHDNKFMRFTGAAISKNTYVGNIAQIIHDNSGYIAPGEIRTISGSIATLTLNAVNSLDNPFGQNVRVLSMDYAETTAGAATSQLTAGIGTANNADYASLFSALPLDATAPAFYNSTKTPTYGTQTIPLIWQTGAGNRYLNMSIKNATATGLVGTYTVTVMGY